MHTRHLSCVVLVDIFWKIEVVSVVDLDKGSWFVLNTLLRSCDFFPHKLGCDDFPGTTICRVTNKTPPVDAAPAKKYVCTGFKR